MQYDKARDYYNRGNAQYNLKQYFEAIKDYDKAIELDPKFAAAYYNRGVAKENLKKYDEAIKDYDKAIELDPNFQPAIDSKKRSEEKKKIKEETETYSDMFDQAAAENARNAIYNLVFMLIAIGITLSAVIGSLFVMDFDNSFSFANMHKILMKFVAISLGVYLISHFSKVHSAEKHLYNLNIQRRNAFSSHQQILKSIATTKSENEKETQNAILLELTKAMFEGQDTGYIKGGNKNALNINPSVKV